MLALDAGKVVAILELDTSQFSSGMTTAQAMLKTLGNSSMSASTRIKAVSSAFVVAGKAMSKSLTLPIVAAGTLATKTFVTFDDAIRQVQATMGLTAETGAGDIAKLTEAAKDMGATTRYTASQAADALNYLALAGYDTNKAIGALPDVLRLAQAGNIDLGFASSLLTDSMSALGLETSKLTGFVDQMAKTSQKSNTTISQLGEGILTVGGTAKKLKGGTIELNTALGILADNGIKSSEGGTALRNIILRLVNPTKEATEAMQKYNLNIYDAEGNMRGLNDIFRDLDAVMTGWTQQQRDALFTSLFNARDLKSAEALISNYGDRWTKLSGQISSAEGAAAQMMDTMEGGLGGSFRNLESAAEAAGIEFGENLAPTVQNAADKVTELTRSFAALPEATQTSIVNIALWTAAAGPMLLVGGKLVGVIGSLVGVLSGPAGWIALGTAGVATLVHLTETMDGANYIFGKAMENMNPDEVRAYSEAFDAINTNIDLTATVNDTTSNDITDAVAALKKTLLGIDVLSNDDRENIVKLIGEDVDPILAALQGQGVDTTTDEGADAASQIIKAATGLQNVVDEINTMFEEGLSVDETIALITADKETIIATLVAKGADPDKADAFATQIIEYRGKVYAACGNIPTSLSMDETIRLLNEDKDRVIAEMVAKGAEPEDAEGFAEQVIKTKAEIDEKCSSIDTNISSYDMLDLLGKSKKDIIKAMKAKGIDAETAEEFATQLVAIKAKLDEACSSLPTNISSYEMLNLLGLSKKAIVRQMKAKGIDDKTAEGFADQIVAIKADLDALSKKIPTEIDTGEALEKLAESKLALVNYLVGKGADPDVAETYATQLETLVASMNTSSRTSINGLTPDDVVTLVATRKSKMVEALAQYNLGDEDISSIVQGLSVAQGKLSAQVGSVYDTIYDKLTDGAADTPEQKKALKAEVQKIYDDMMSQIDIDTEEGAAYAEELKTLQKSTVEYIESMSGKSTEAVKAEKGKLDMLRAWAQQVAAEIAALAAEAEDSLNNQSVKLVRAGVTSDSDTVGKAFEATYQDYGLKKLKNKDDAEKKRQEANDKWEADREAADKLETPELREAKYAEVNAAYKAETDKINADEQAQNEVIQNQYKANLNSLFAGLMENFAAGNPETAEAMYDMFNKQTLLEQLQKALKENENGETTIDRSVITDELMKLMFPENWDQISLDDLGANQLLANIGMAIQDLLSDTSAFKNAFTGENGGPAMNALNNAIEAGLLGGLDGLDLSEFWDRLGLMLGKVNTGDDKSPTPVTTDIEVVPGDIDVSKVQPAIDDSLNPPDETVTVTVENGDSSGLGAETTDAFAEGIESKKGEATKAASAVTNAVKTQLGRGRGMAKTEGENVGEGFVEGIRAYISEAYSTAYDAAAAAQQGLHDGSENGSPSRAARREARFVGEGFVIGLKDMLETVRQAGYSLGVAGLTGLNAISAHYSGSALRDAQPETRDSFANRANTSSAPASQAALAGTNLVLNVNNPVVRNDGDIRKIRKELDRYQRELSAGRGRR